MVGPLYQWVLHPQIQSTVDLQLWMQRANHIFKFWAIIYIIWASLVAQKLRHLPAMWETRVRSLGQEDPLEKEMATHSSIFAWRIPWMEEPIRLQSTGSQSWTRLSDFTFTLKFTSLYEGFSDCLFKVSSPVNFII